MSKSYSHYDYDYDPGHKYEKYKDVPTTFSNEFFKDYSKYFKPDSDPSDDSTISNAIDLIYLADDKSYKKYLTYNIKSFIDDYLNFHNTKYNHRQILEISKKIIEYIQYANSQKLWNKCWDESETNFVECPKKSMVSRLVSIFSKRSKSSKSRRGGKRKNNRKTKKYRNK